jgi:hypothetical protein
LDAQRGLVDGGSQGNCIQREFSQDVQTTHKLKTSPTTMIMADGNQSPAGPITHYDLTTICTAVHEEQLALDVTSLSHPLIIGMPWLRKHNPHVDYYADTMTFDSELCRQNCEHYGKKITLYPSDQQDLTPGPKHPLQQDLTPDPEFIPHAKISGEAQDEALEQPIDAVPTPAEFPPGDPSRKSATRAKISLSKRKSHSRSGKTAHRAKFPPKVPPISSDAVPSDIN